LHSTLQTLGKALPYVDEQLFRIGSTNVTPLSVLIFVLTVLIAVAIGRFARRGIHRYFKDKEQTEGIAYALERMVQLVAVVLGVLIGLQNIGIDLTALAAIGAMLSVGIGFGLQGLAQNFVSGITLLIERPVQKGDFVIIGDTVGRVDEIAMRSTRVLTRDGVAIIVPNHDLLTTRVVNLSRPDRMYRTRIAVGVAYGSDTREVERALLYVASKHPKIIRTPAPVVFFRDFGESSLDFELAVWINSAELEPQIVSDLRFAIDQSFRKRGIEIPFPQRDLHIKSDATRPKPGSASIAPSTADALAPEDRPSRSHKPG